MTLQLPDYCDKNVATEAVIKARETKLFKLRLKPERTLVRGEQVLIALRFKSIKDLGRSAFILASKPQAVRYEVATYK